MGDQHLFPGLDDPSDARFQEILLEFSTAASQGIPALALIETFCRTARQYFRVDGVYFWRRSSSDELVGVVADGLRAGEFPGMRLKDSDSAVTAEAVRTRKTVYINRVDVSRHTTAAEFHAKALMAAPLVVAGEVIGAAVFLHGFESDFFNDNLAAKATILCGQMGSLLEASRLSEVAEQGHRRAEILAEVAQALHAIPEASAAVQVLAERVRLMFGTNLVCVLMRHPAPAFELRAVSAKSREMELAARARHDRKGLHFAADLAGRAVAAGEVITVTVDPATHSLGDMIEGGTLMAAPFRTSSGDGAILVYPRPGGAYGPQEKSLISAIAGFGAVAIANAELYETAQAQAQELQQLLAISSELGSLGDLDQFLQKFALRAGDFLGFERSLIGLWEDGAFRIRWGAEQGECKRLDLVIPEGPASKSLANKEVFWTDTPAITPGANLEIIAAFNIRQLLTVPLLAADGSVLGMFGVLDRKDRLGISQEDVRRAQVLAGQVAMALEVTRNLHLSEQYRARAESLMRLAIGLNSLLRLPDFAATFVDRAVDITSAKGAGLAVVQGSAFDWLVLKDASGKKIANPEIAHRLAQAAQSLLANQSEAIVSLSAAAFLVDSDVANLGWNRCTLLKLHSSAGEITGLLCLNDVPMGTSPDDRRLLQAIAAHGAVALENARLFTRMDQANRHWTEIFDSISDFIVAHDESDKVLRVNRSLANFIGSEPQALVGVSTWALLGMCENPAFRACPFCLITSRGADEYSHPALDRTYLVSTSRVHGANNERLQTVHVLKDITDRREAERRYRELFDNIQEGLFFSTPDGRFIEVNEALVRMLGFGSREELLQSDVRTQIYSSDDRHRELAALMEKNGALRNHEETLKRKDGQTIHVLINAFAVRDAQLRVLQYRGLMLDITGLKNFQAELQRERDFSGKILNNTQSFILVVDTDGLITYANRRWYEMGYEQSSVLGHRLVDLVVPNRRETLEAALAETVSGRAVDNLELQILNGKGRAGQFALNLSPMRDEQGNVSSIVVVMSDVTDAATLQAKLLHTEKMAAVGQLVSGVAHEVNNPLTAILGFSDLLMENPEVPESARKDLRVILQEAQRTKQIVQNLLSFARQMPPQKQPLQLTPILKRTVQLRSYDLHSRGVEVVEQFAGTLPQVVGDAHQLQQVFLNIINNAYDAVRDKGRAGRIEIVADQRGEFVEISFRDNGTGILNADRIFDPFFTTKEVGQGTGLGLSICYGIVHEHGGEILCENNPGGGARFIVRLPAARPATSIGMAAGVVQT